MCHNLGRKGRLFCLGFFSGNFLQAKFFHFQVEREGSAGLQSITHGLSSYWARLPVNCFSFSLSLPLSSSSAAADANCCSLLGPVIAAPVCSIRLLQNACNGRDGDARGFSLSLSLSHRLLSCLPSFSADVCVRVFYGLALSLSPLSCFIFSSSS